MPINPTYPGVYVQELPSLVKTIIGVGTSITVFIGRAQRGPTDDYTLIHNFTEFGRIYGGLSAEYNMSYAVYQYYQNGGTDAVIIRVVHFDSEHPENNPLKAQYPVDTTFTLEAASEGIWGNDLEITIDTKDINIDPTDSTIFNLSVDLVKYANKNAQIEALKGKTSISSEFFRNLSTDPKNKFKYVTNVLKEESKLVRIADPTKVALKQPKDTKDEKGINSPPDSTIKGKDSLDLVQTDYYNAELPDRGLNLLNKVDLFNMICIPSDDHVNNKSVPKEVYIDALTNFCIKRRAMLIVDAPEDWTDAQDAKTKVDDTNNFITRHENAAVWFPLLLGSDPLDKDGKMREFVPCGTIAGIIARTDTNRGVWKAPAGIEATLFGFSDLKVKLDDDANGVLNPRGINCIRNFPGGYGMVLWGARTLRGADNLTDQWKYLPVRRTALYIEESLYRGTKWVVFEPNDERLWSQIRLNVGAFMHDLFRKGAFQGTDPKKAYLVKCDSETTTQEDIDKGIVNILVGFAPLKPAEFVMIQIAQLTNQDSLT